VNGGPEALDVSPEDFARMVRGAGDEDIRTVVRGLGTEAVLERIFDEMVRRFVPEKARGVDAVIQFEVTDGEDEHHHEVTVREGACRSSKGRAEQPTVILRMDLVPFVRLVAGEAKGPVLYMTGKLRVKGNPMLAAGVASFFRTPEP
jgi:putative sterol carrier protein